MTIFDKLLNLTKLVQPKLNSNDSHQNKKNRHTHEVIIQNIEEMAGVGILNYELKTNTIFWSDELARIFGVKQHSHLTPEIILNNIHPDDHNEFISSYQTAIQNKTGYRARFRVVRNDGTERLLDQYTDVVFDNDNKVVGVIGTIFDITEKYTGKHSSTEKNDKINEITNYLEEGIWSIDKPTNKVLICSKGIEQICGYSLKEFEKNELSWENLVFEDDFDEYNLRQEMLELKKVPKSEYRIVHKNGEIRWVQDVSIPTYDEDRKLIRLDGIITDITEQKSMQTQLTQFLYLTYHDELTNLPNRRKFNEEVNELLEKSSKSNSKFAILFLDVDGFKRINDSLGHQAGDELLKMISLRLQKSITLNDFVARIGGDEFSVLIRNMIDREQIVKTAKKILESLIEPYFIDAIELNITASIGISTFPVDGNDAKTLVRKADSAHFHIKETGNNNFHFYTPAISEESYNSYVFDQDLRKAVVNNEFTMHYQAKMDTKTKHMIGAEALIRWNHPEGKLISAGEFIPIAEEIGLIYDITIWTFRTVCEQIKKWEGMEMSLVPISVNISPKIFNRNNWVNILLGIIEETNVNPHLLELEITESVLIQDDGAFIDSIDILKAIGIKISIDDFGTGYSSLLYLRKYKVDTIKIDQSFTRDILMGNNASITKSIIHLAHELNITVIAEGVETKEQYTFYRHHECDHLQGFLISKPIPTEAFEQLLANPLIRIDGGENIQLVENNRKGFRIDLTFPLSSKMTIIQFKGKSVGLGKTEVLVEDIGVGGLRFMSHVALPVNPDIVLEFETTILDEEVKLMGKVVWKEIMGEFYQYGIQFILSDNEQTSLIKLLNTFAIQLRKNPLLSNCRFVQEGKTQFLKTARG